MEEVRTSGRSLVALVLIVLPSVLGAEQNSPEALQARGIERLDHFRDEVRQSGMRLSQLSELDIAASELALSYRGFAAASNLSQAAWSLVRLADCERQAALVSRVTSTTQAPAGGQRAEALAASARDHYKEAAALARKTGTSLYLVKALTGLALVYETQYHDYGSASPLVTEAMRAASSCPDPQGCRREALEAKVELETGRGELFSAASHVNGLLSLLKHGSDANMEYRAYADRADIYYRLADGCSDSFEKSPEVCYRLFDLGKADWVKAWDIARQAGFHFLASVAEGQISDLGVLRSLTERYNSHAQVPANTFNPKVPKDVLATEIPPLGQIPPSLVQTIKALKEAAGPALPGALATYVQASMDDMQGRPDIALEGYLRAIHTVEEDRQKVSEDSARSSFLDDKVAFYDRPILMLLRNKRYAEAFDLLESTRARVTAELLSTKSVRLSNRVDRRLFAALALQRAEITSLQTRFFNGIFSPETSGQDDPDAVASEQTRLAGLEEDYQQRLLHIAGEVPRAQNVAVSPPASLAAVQSALRHDAAELLYYHLLDWAVILVHIGPDSVGVRDVFLPRYELKTKVAGLVDSMRKRDAPFRDDLAKELFLFLIQPAIQWLRTDRLIVIPQGDLDTLPFQALEDPADGTFVGERFQITYTPSASILLQLKKQGNLADDSLLAAADPSLPGSPQEVKTLASLYPVRQKVLTDSLVRKADLLQWAARYDILHLAVHGEFDAEEPLLSRVELAPRPGLEGDLTAAEMFGLPLGKARLVTLSACETGRVRTTRANEIQGIQQALLFAGAQSLLVSAWKVDSESSSLWMQIFYREAQTKTLAEAEREAIRGLRRDPRFSHPHHWAPFLLIAR